MINSSRELRDIRRGLPSCPNKQTPPKPRNLHSTTELPSLLSVETFRKLSMSHVHPQIDRCFVWFQSGPTSRDASQTAVIEKRPLGGLTNLHFLPNAEFRSLMQHRQPLPAIQRRQVRSKTLPQTGGFRHCASGRKPADIQFWCSRQLWPC